MKKGIVLQDRDFEILRLIYLETVTSFEKLKVRIFKSVNTQTASNRLNRLVKGGYLRKFRAGLVIYHGKPRQVQVVFTISPQGIQALKVRDQKLIWRSDPVPLNSHTLIHDLVLGDVIDVLQTENPKRQIVNSKLLEFSSTRNEQVPDAIILKGDGENDAGETAIELEMSVKSERRYREIVTQYRLMPRFKKVLFIYFDDGVLKKMASVLRFDLANNQGDGSNESVSFSKFEFRKLETVIKKGELNNGSCSMQMVA